MWLEQDKNNCCLQDVFKRKTLTSLYHCHDLDDLDLESTKSTKSSDSAALVTTLPKFATGHCVNLRLSSIIALPPETFLPTGVIELCSYSENALRFIYLFCLFSLNFSSNLLRLNGNIWTFCSRRAQPQVYTSSAGADRTASAHTLCSEHWILPCRFIWRSEN